MRSAQPAVGPATVVPARSRDVRIPFGSLSLAGEFVAPSEDDQGVVVFVHGSGSSRHSPRDRMIAKSLHALGMGTLQFDLRTAEEESLDRIIGWLRFDPEGLAQRVVQATRWVLEQPGMQDRKIGYFGAGSGVAAALLASAQLQDTVTAVVCRGGRTDLAGETLSSVRAATLLLVGEMDHDTLAINRDCLSTLQCEKELVVIPGADHGFREPGTLDQAATMTATWLHGYLTTGLGFH